MTTAERIKEKAREVGFELVGIAQALPVPDYRFFLGWLARGFDGTMEYLRRGVERRGDPGQILPGVRSIICCGLNYETGGPRSPRSCDPEGVGRPRISRYAWGEDYHQVVGARLKELERFIRESAPEARTKAYVDTGPILERSYAARAGLGWIGKNTMLIHNGLGSFFFLGEILTTLDLEPDRPTFDQCGSCTRCLEACPTGALREPGVLDSNRCISYLTIEYRPDFTPEQAQAIGHNVYGCDICQEVCPYNERIPVTPVKEFFPREKAGPPNPQNSSNPPNPRISERQWRRNLKAVAGNGSRRTTDRSVPGSV